MPIAFQVQGLYRLRRGRSRVDDFFAVFVGSILAVVLGIIGTLYFQTYYVPDELKDQGVYEVSQPVWALFLVITVSFAYASRELVREALERRWRAGIGLKRVLIAGAGDLGRLVADKVLEHRELGFKVVGFLDDRAGGDHIGYRGLPLLGMLADADEVIRSEKIDHVYVALPLEEHVKMLGARRGDQPRRGRRARRPRPAAVHRAAGAPREPRRRPDHQPQRRPAARIQQRPQADDRRGDFVERAARPLDPVPASSPR